MKQAMRRTRLAAAQAPLAPLWPSVSRSTWVLGVVLALGIFGTRWVKLNCSPSAPYGFYRLRPVPAALTPGLLVVLPVPASVQHVWPFWVPIMKPVAAVAGDEVCVQAQRLVVRGVDYGVVYDTAHGMSVPHLDAGCQIVPPGAVFLGSQEPKSLDSRYFASVPLAAVVAVATPLWTWR
jgi:type IV secretory pathway protease TraF